MLFLLALLPLRLNIPLLELFAGSMFGMFIMFGMFGMFGIAGISGIAGKIDPTEGALFPKNNMITTKRPMIDAPNIANGAISCSRNLNWDELYSYGNFV
jgi:hypothetical protein